MLSARDLAAHLAWSRLSTEQRRAVGADWYRNRNRFPHPPPAGWTDHGRARHRSKVKRSMALLIAMQADPVDVVGLQAELDAVREEMGRLRLRADLGTQLAEAQSEAMRLTALLTTDARFTGADTKPLQLPGPRGGGTGKRVAS